MKRIIPTLLLPLLLGGCTGTFEGNLTTLLLVGYVNEADQGALALVEDLGDVNEGFDLLEESVRILPSGVPVDYTVVDRANTRRQVVVLSREDDLGEDDTLDEGEGGPAALNFFNIGGVDPTNPANFAAAPPFAAPSLDATLLLSEVDTSEFPGTVAFCPVAVQTSASGRFVALLNDQSVCDDAVNARDAVDVIDLQAAGGPELIARVDIAVVAGAFYLSQGSNRLYYFINTAAGARLQYLALEALLPVDTGVVLDLRADDEIRDLGPVDLDPDLASPSEGDFIALTDDAFFPLRGLDATPAPIQLPFESRELISDDYGLGDLDDYDVSDPLLILGDDRLTVYLATQTAAGAVLYEGEDVLLNRYTADPAGGTIFNDFAYIVGEGSIVKFDILSYASLGVPEDGLGDLDRFIGVSDVDEIINPIFVTWVRAVNFGDAPQAE